MPKNKPNKGLLKRIRFTKTGKVKFRRAFGRHKRSHKSGSLLQSYRRPSYAKASELKRIRTMTCNNVRSQESAARESAAGEQSAT